MEKRKPWKHNLYSGRREKVRRIRQLKVIQDSFRFRPLPTPARKGGNPQEKGGGGGKPPKHYQKKLFFIKEKNY